MEQIQLSIPWSFIRSRCVLTWTELLYGMDNTLIHPDGPIELAMDLLAEKDDASSELLELASLDTGKATRKLVESLAASEQNFEKSTASEKWLFLVLAWLFESRDTLSEPLRLLGHVYADFGYPETMAPFVHYMSSDEPDLGSKSENESRLLSKWRRYLEDEGRRLQSLPSHGEGATHIIKM